MKERMRATDLDPKELIAFDPAAGEIRVADERAILVDATAMGVLRKDLVEQIGTEGTRALLTRFGFVQAGRWPRRPTPGSSGSRRTSA